MSHVHAENKCLFCGLPQVTDSITFLAVSIFVTSGQDFSAHAAGFFFNLSLAHDDTCCCNMFVCKAEHVFFKHLFDSSILLTCTSRINVCFGGLPQVTDSITFLAVSIFVTSRQVFFCSHSRICFTTCAWLRKTHFVCKMFLFAKQNMIV